MIHRSQVPRVSRVLPILLAATACSEPIAHDPPTPRRLEIDAVGQFGSDSGESGPVDTTGHGSMSGGSGSGVPLRIELGPKDLAKGQVAVKMRIDTAAGTGKLFLDRNEFVATSKRSPKIGDLRVISAKAMVVCPPDA